MNARTNNAAQYIRMSTDGQELSPAVQRAAIAAYAAERGLEIVASYEDLGHSGLRIENREQMKRLIADVMGSSCPFRTILVYDVSRWGRFQDTDASAYYEYHCRLHGVQVIYVGEPFSRDHSPLSAVVKSLKRAMAAEYSRDLRVKTLAGQLRSISCGYEMGTLPCLGFRRIAERKDGRGQRPLDNGERSNVATERVRWVRGPAKEVALVRSIFSMYAEQTATIESVAKKLRDSGARSRGGLAFTPTMVASLLHCEAFIGNFVWGRKTLRTKSDEVRHLELPGRSEGTVDALVPKCLWNAVQEKLASRHRDRRSREQLISELRQAVKATPTLKAAELVAHGCATRKVYEREFGSMRAAFVLAGRDANSVGHEHFGQGSYSREVSMAITSDIRLLLRRHGLDCVPVPRRSAVDLPGGNRVRVQVCWQRRGREGLAWFLPKLSRACCEDYVLVARMATASTAEGFFLIAKADYPGFPLWMGAEQRPQGGLWIDCADDLLSALRQISVAQPLERSMDTVMSRRVGRRRSSAFT